MRMDPIGLYRENRGPASELDVLRFWPVLDCVNRSLTTIA